MIVELKPVYRIELGVTGVNIYTPDIIDTVPRQNPEVTRFRLFHGPYNVYNVCCPSR